MSSYPTLPTGPRAMPKPAKVSRARAKIRPFADGRAQVLLDGLPVGIYASETAAEAGVAVMRRMGVAS